MSGYSGKPLHAKLGLKDGQRVTCVSELDFESYRRLLGPGAPALDLSAALRPETDVVHVFTPARDHLVRILPDALDSIKRDGMVWVSWPKKASKVPTDVTEDVVREVALPLGLVDVKVCAVDAIYSGLKLVIRKELR